MSKFSALSLHGFTENNNRDELSEAIHKVRWRCSNDLKQNASTQLEQLQILPFRKMKFSNKMYYEKNDYNLVKRLRSKFGHDPILIIGDWSAPNTKYQEPTRSKGLVSMLRKNGFKVYCIGEFRTSSFCPDCENPLEKFKLINNSRPYQREKMPNVLCHSLLRCKNTNCLKEYKGKVNAKKKLWNRDLAATLNFKKILISLRNGKRHSLFIRQK
ncbi:unnamed protein product [Rhizopus stolonifer]